MDSQGYYAMPGGPAIYSREPSPAAQGMGPSRSQSRQRRGTASSQERPILSVQEGHHHRSYHTTQDGRLSTAPTPPPMIGRSVSVNDHRPGTVRVASTPGGGMSIAYPNERLDREMRPARSHSRAASSGSGFSYDEGFRRRPASYYAGSSWENPRSNYDPIGRTGPSPSHTPYGRSPSGSFTSPSYAMEIHQDARAPVFGGATGLPAAPPAPISSYKAEDDLARLTAAKLELENLKRDQENERGRATERKIHELRAQAEQEAEVNKKLEWVEKQTAVALAMKEEAERIKFEAELRLSQQDMKAMQAARRGPQHVVVQKPTTPAPGAAAKPKPPVKQATLPNPVAAAPPPKNLSDYQAKVPKNLISRAALVEMGFPYEEHKDYLLVRRYLSKDDIKALLDRTEEIRKQRAAHEKYKAAQAAAAAKAAADAMRPQVYRTTTTGGREVNIVTVPQALPRAGTTKEQDWREEKRLWEAEQRALQEKQAKEQAEFDRRRKENEDRFKALEAKEASERAAARASQQQKPRRKSGWFS